MRIFRCKMCEVLERQLAQVQAQNERLMGRLLEHLPQGAAPLPQTVSDSPDYYGGGEDEQIDFDDFGQRITKLQ